MNPTSFVYYIEIAGTCNLRCPSCPNGNTHRQIREPIFMPADLYAAILEKINRESPADTTILYLINWGEPTLHPELPRMIAMARQAGLVPHLSSNLAAPRDLEGMTMAGPASLRISLSGYFQETYGRTHIGGDIERVKDNMRALAGFRTRHHASFPVQVCYHRYVHNMGADYANMQELAHSLGFDFLPLWAFFAPLEKLLDLWEGRPDDQDRALLDLLAIEPKEAQHIALSHRQEYPDCPLRRSQTAINVDGSVALCCALYDKAFDLPLAFLDHGHAALQAAKYSHPMCARCMAAGGDLYYQYAGQQALDRVAYARLARRTPSVVS